jgi:two-component system sensor histidine kinase/response regulator
MRHKLLARQVSQAFGHGAEQALAATLADLHHRGDHALADALVELLTAADQSYGQFERELEMRTRMLDISSAELTSANEQLRSESARQRDVLQSLQNSVHRLTYGAGVPMPPAEEVDFDADLLGLTHALEALVKQREAARDALTLTEAANRRILNSLREVVFQTDLDGNWVYLNPAWQNITGFALEDTLGKPAMGFLHTEDQRSALPRVQDVLARREPLLRQQMRFRTVRGGWRWLEVFATRLESEERRTVGLSGSLIDITDQKLAQDQLIVSEERLNQALRATDSPLWDWDMSKPQPYVDPAWLVNLGYPMNDPALQAIEWQKQLHPDDVLRWQLHLREHLSRERAELDIELRFATFDNQWRYTLVRGKAIAWDGKRALRLAGTVQDITARKEAEQSALRQQELTEQILDQLPIPVFLKDRDGRFVRFNRRFQELSQRSRREILGHKIEDFASRGWTGITQQEDAMAWETRRMVTSERRLTNVDPPVDLLVMRIVIASGGESYLLGFSIDMSEQRAARDAMQRAVESAEAASRAKSEFLANMSHEIRTPMNGILGMTELVLESSLTPEQRDDIALVKASAHALLTIINDILDFSKIEAGKLDIEEVPFDLRKLVTETVRSMALRAQQKSLELVCELPADLPRTMKGDPGRLRQVLINLLGNAIKFTQQGKVALTLRAGREIDGRCEVAFAVADTGIGIPPDKQKLIFEAFSQVDGSTTREYGGTGLGLTICRRLVILMQGSIEVDSTPGQGSTFRFTVPLKPTAVNLRAPLPLSWLAGKTALLADPSESSREQLRAALEQAGLFVTECSSAEQAHLLLAAQHPALIVLDGDMPDIDAFSVARLPNRPPLLLVTSNQRPGVDSLRFTPDASVPRPVSNEALLDAILNLLSSEPPVPLVQVSESAPAPALDLPKPVPSTSNTGMRILLAEDNPVNQRLALRLLEKLGHRVTLVDNGMAALDQATRASFDLILMDVQMPGLDGLSATRHIRQWESSHGGHVPIIAMTARAMQGDRERCLEAGMDDYLSKPVDSERLRQVIGQYDPEQVEPVLAWRAALGRLDGDCDLLLELAAIFLDDGPQLLATMVSTIAERDLPGAQRAVHSIKGVLVNFGAQRAIAHAERLSASLHDPTQSALWAQMAQDMAPDLDDVYAALRELIAGGAPAMRSA